MLKKGSYIPWVSRFLRYIDGKKDYGKMLEDSIYNGPYKMKPIMDPRNTTGDPIVKPYPRLKKEEDLTGDDKKRFKADIDAMNAILLGIPNDIYNFVDACKTPQTMWQRMRRLMHGTDISKQEMTSRLIDEEKYGSKTGCWLVLAGRLGKGLYKLGCDRGRLKMIKVQIFYDHVNPAIRQTINQAAGGKLRDKNAEESWALLEDLALYDNESWNDPRDFAKPVKEISLPQDVLSTFDRRLIELENQVQCLMEAHLAPKSSIQVNKITSSCEICSGPQYTQYCMENLEQAFVDYASLHTNEEGGKWYTYKPEQNNLGDSYNPS
ncbi:hypothetical protein Tco_1553472 [Tanacetum coccineum]